MKNSSPKKQSANCWPTVVYRLFCQQSADCRQFVGQVSVENPCRIPEKPQLAGKNIAYRREMKLSHLSPPYCFGFFKGPISSQSPMFRFFRYQTPHNPIASSSQSRSKKLFTAASCSFFFLYFTKSEHYQLIFTIGH